MASKTPETASLDSRFLTDKTQAPELIHHRVGALRPPVFTRDSNEDVTQLVNLTSTPPEGTNSPPKQQNEDRPMTPSYPPRNKWRIISICLWLVAGGFSDAAPGALLPHIEAYYNINYTIVSLIWMSNAAGFILVACLANKIQPWLGKRLSMTVGSCFSIAMYSIVLSGGPYPLVVAAFFLGGVGIAIVLTQSNIFLSKLEKLSKYLSFFHGSYGVGATISPLAATSLVTSGVQWHYFYLINLALVVVAAVLFWFSFHGADLDLKPWDYSDQDEKQPLRDRNAENEAVEAGTEIQELPSRGPKKAPNDSKNDMRLALSSSTTWLVALWVFFYQGGEVALGGWVVTYLLAYRNGPPSVGYVASGFWGGLTLGRLLLTRPLHKCMGARRSITMASLFSIVGIALTWAVPNVVAAGVFVSLAGVTIGPNYPLMIASVTSGIIPGRIQVVALTIATAFGSSGGAVFPFLVGIISQRVGAFVVLPVFLVLYSCMLVLWLCLPNVERRERSGRKKPNLWQHLW